MKRIPAWHDSIMRARSVPIEDECARRRIKLKGRAADRYRDELPADGMKPI
jgi:hypothetical protein